MGNAQREVGRNIRYFRTEKGLSQGELARLLRVDRSYISALESGSRNPSLKTLEGIAKALGVGTINLINAAHSLAAFVGERMPYVPGATFLRESTWVNHEWYHQRFDGSPYLLHMIAEAEIATDRNDKYGLFFDHHFCFFEDGKADWYIDTEEIKRVSETILALFQTYPDVSQKLMREYEPRKKDFYAACVKIGETKLYDLSNRELLDLHDEYVNAVLHHNSSSSIIDGFALGTDRLLEERLKDAYAENKKLRNQYTFGQIFSIVTTPSHSSFVREAELELFRLILKIRQTPAQRKGLIREYAEKFFWIRNNYIDATVLSATYFEQEIARIESTGLDIAEEVARIEAIPRENAAQKLQILTMLNLDEQTLCLVHTTEDFTEWQDERKKATMFTAHYATLLLEEVSRRSGIPLELLKYMVPEEISNIFLAPPNHALLEERRQKSVLYWSVNGHEVLTGDDVERVRTKLLGNRELLDVRDFRGMTASLGKVDGRVKILRSVKEIDKLKDGEILVAVMTRPDYVPAMRRAAAIITDEGGITSHAAIVSRELKIPCIIGTKIATQLLKDGDLVEVNANHGVVKIKERHS